jgi:hypothetical protein
MRPCVNLNSVASAKRILSLPCPYFGIFVIFFWLCIRSPRPYASKPSHITMFGLCVKLTVKRRVFRQPTSINFLKSPGRMTVPQEAWWTKSV